MTTLQPASMEDVHSIFEALLKMRKYSSAPQMRLTEPRHAVAHLQMAAAKQHLWVFGDFAILIDVGSPWYSAELVLIEEIIVRFRKEHGNTVDSAVAQLDVLALRFGCAAIAAGDTQIGLMSPRYLAAGFKTLGTQFYKEMP